MVGLVVWGSVLDEGVMGTATAIRSGEVSVGEVVDAAIERVERLDSDIGAVVTPLFERARRRAAAIVGDEPFAGVPMLLKDAGQELAGTPHWVGVAALRDAGHISTTTTSLAARVEALGFVIIGKSATPALSAGVTTEPPGFPPTRNPWHRDRTVGGSSGGSAAAVAAGMVPVAHGSDATGSLRFPASCCGVATLKPTAGVIASTPPAGQPDRSGVWAEFVLARRADDLIAVFDALRGTSPVAVVSRTDRLPRRPLRIGLLTADPILGLPLDPACGAAVEAVGAVLRGLGHTVDDEWPRPLEGLMAPLASPIATVTVRLRAAQARWVENRLGRPLATGDLPDEVLATIEQARQIDDATMAAAEAAIRDAMTPIPRWWDDHDVLVTPTMRRPPWELGRAAGPMECGLFAAPFSFTGQPVLAVPASVDADGLPIGVQLVGRQGDDELLLAVGAQLDNAMSWSTYRPPPPA